MNEFKLDYTPRQQFKAFHTRSQRWASLACHRRAGKTLACVYELIIRALYTKKKNARYAYIAPYRNQAKDVAWQYLKEAVQGLATQVRESDLRVILPNAAWITLYGADNPDALRGMYFDGVVLDEYGDSRPSLWKEVLLPALADRKGWAVFIGTAKGKNHFYRTHQQATLSEHWFDMTLKASESGLIDEEELRQLKLQMEEAEFQQEFECDFTAALKGTYYADKIQLLEAEDRIAPKAAQWDPSLPVHVAMDLGRKDATAIWFWQEPPETDDIHIFDFRLFTGQVVDNFINLFRELPYEFETVWVPHDATAHTVQTRRSSIEQFIDAKIPARMVPRLSRQQGIDAARMILPRCRIDSNACEEGIEGLRSYRREYDERTKVFRDTPLHNWASDPADGFRYLALVARQKRGSMTTSTNSAQRANTTTATVIQHGQTLEVPAYRLDDLFSAQQRSRPLSVARRRI